MAISETASKVTVDKFIVNDIQTGLFFVATGSGEVGWGGGGSSEAYAPSVSLHLTC